MNEKRKPTAAEFQAVLDAAGEIIRGYGLVVAAGKRGELSQLGKYVQRKRVLVQPGAPAEYDLVGVVVPVKIADRLQRALLPFVVGADKGAGN